MLNPKRPPNKALYMRLLIEYFVDLIHVQILIHELYYGSLFKWSATMTCTSDDSMPEKLQRAGTKTLVSMETVDDAAWT